MATRDQVDFGSVLDRQGSDKKVWFVVTLVVLAVIGFAAWGAMQGSQTGALEREVKAQQARAEEAEKAVEQRDKMLVDARKDESLMRSAGAAVGVFYAVDPKAQESGVAFAHPAEKAVRVYLYGLGAPPEGQRYAVLARTGEGKAKLLGEVLPDDSGDGFLLSRDVPEGTKAIELVFLSKGEEGKDTTAQANAADKAPQGNEATKASQGTGTSGNSQGTATSGASKGSEAGKESPPDEALDKASPRIAALYPAEDRRGILMKPVQARRR